MYQNLNVRQSIKLMVILSLIKHLFSEYQLSGCILTEACCDPFSGTVALESVLKIWCPKIDFRQRCSSVINID